MPHIPQLHYDTALANWEGLNRMLMKYRGATGLAFAQELLKREEGGQARLSVIKRILQRVCALEGEQRRTELMHRIKRGRSRQQ